MKKLKFLKNLLSFFYYSSFLFVLLMIIEYFKILFDYNVVLPINIMGVEFTTIDITVKVVFFLVVISALLFIYTISLLRKVISLFIKNEIFSEQVILLLNKIGTTLIAVSLIKGIPILMYKFLFSDILNQENQTHFSNFHLSEICLGLFFLVLAEVFKMAKNLKEENDLMI